MGNLAVGPRVTLVEGFTVTHFLITADVAKSVAFYSGALGGKVVTAGEPTPAQDGIVAPSDLLLRTG